MSTRTSVTYHEATVPMGAPLEIQGVKRGAIRILDVRRIGPDHQYSYIMWDTEEVDAQEEK